MLSLLEIYERLTAGVTEGLPPISGSVKVEDIAAALVSIHRQLGVDVFGRIIVSSN